VDSEGEMLVYNEAPRVLGWGRASMRESKLLGLG